VASVGVGLVVAVSFFLFNYSQTNVLRYVSTGRLLRSRLARNAAQEAWLSTHGDHICVFGLQGYIFFGTAYNLQKDILARVADPNQMPVHCVIFDFRYMTGIDASVVEYFHKLYLELNRKEIIVLFAEVPPPYQGLMQKMSFMQAFTEGFIELVSLDEALEWSEDYLLKKSGLPSNPTRSLFQVFTEYFSDSSKAAILLNYFKRLELPSGFKIIEQNTVAYDLFFLESGRLSTYSEEAGRPPIRLETIVDETIVGEVSFYLGQLRIATIITEEPSIVYRLSMDALTQMENEHPIVAMAFHRLIIQKIAQRLTNVNKNVKRLL
jgi:SulP family sulfate permease